MIRDEAARLQLAASFPNERPPLATPVTARGDGACLPNSVSLALTGSEGSSHLIRLAAHLFLIQHKPLVLEHLHRTHHLDYLVSDTSQEAARLLQLEDWGALFDLEVRRGQTPHADLGKLHLLGIACALRRPLRCLMAAPLGEELTFEPLEEVPQQAERVTVFWCAGELVRPSLPILLLFLLAPVTLRTPFSLKSPRSSHFLQKKKRAPQKPTSSPLGSAQAAWWWAISCLCSRACNGSPLSLSLPHKFFFSKLTPCARPLPTQGERPT
jgi:hypothetical protein